MFGKSNALPFLLWLLHASFFNQVEGNNPVSSNSSKVSKSSSVYRRAKTWLLHLPACAFSTWAKKISFVKQLGIEGIR